MVDKSLYEELGVSPRASPEDVRKAHRRMARKHHPDTGGEREAFERVQRAADVLRDPQRRLMYDRTGKAEAEPDNSESGAVQMLVAAFQQALQMGEVERRDVIGTACDLLRRQSADLGMAKASVEQDKRRTEQAIKRLKHKGGKANHLDFVMRDQLQAIEAALAQIEMNRAAVKRALELANDYSWDVDAAPVMRTMFIGTGGTTASGVRIT